MRFLYLALAAAVLHGADASAQSTADVTRFIGEWHGTLQTPGPALRLGLTIRQGATGQPTGVLRSIDQGSDIPATLAVRGDSVFVEMSLIGASYAAALTADRDTLRGSFRQGGGVLPLTMQRGPATASSTSAAPSATAVPHPVTARPVDASPHRSRITMADGVRIHSLDWGGTDTALVFIPGLGNSAHVFDDFAPRFTDRFRVVALSRVGFGESEQPEAHGYDLASRVAQIAAVLDSLGITRAVLVGHSLGGDEITAFASAHPARTAALIYLDAAYDHSTAAQTQAVLARYAGGAPRPTATDLASPRAFQQYQHRTSGIQMPLGELLASMTLDERGAVVGQRATAQVLAASMAAIRPIDYSRVRAPALALYSARTTAADVMPWLRADSAANTRATEELRATILADEVRERARFTREVPGAKAISFRAHHYQFLSNADETERYVRRFLASLSTARGK
jgi:pimeloyl-ACP methyl ester carboxylesterase